MPADTCAKSSPSPRSTAPTPAARAIDDALVFNAFSSEYIAHLLESRARTKSAPTSPLSLTRRADLLDLELPEPDLSIYEVADDE